MASIDKRENTYRIRVSAGKDANGKRVFETMTYTPKAKSPTKIKKEVEAVAVDFERRVKEGLYISGDKITFSEYISIWREQWAVDNLTQAGLESYEASLRRRAIPNIGNLPIGAIRPTHIQNIITIMKNEGRAPKTIRRDITCINSVFRYAYDMEVIKDNPCDRVKCPRNPSKDELHYFTPEQVQTFFKALEREYDYVIPEHRSKSPKTGEQFSVKEYKHTTSIPFQWRVFFNLAIFGAFRRGELIGLKWTDIDWDNKIVNIRRATAKTKGGQIDKTPKTRSGVRSISLPASSMNLLREWYSKQKELSVKYGTLWEGSRGKDFDNNYVFISMESGKQMCVDTPTGKFSEIISMYNATCEREEDKLPKIRLHDLRHTSATLLIGNGVDISTVSHRLGHAHSSVTLDVYSHFLQSKDEIASETLEKILQA